MAIEAGKEKWKSKIDPSMKKFLEDFGDAPPSIAALAIVHEERKARRDALVTALSEEDAATIMAGQPMLGTLANERTGIKAGAPMNEENILAYNMVVEDIFYLASWRKSLEDFYVWQQRRKDMWDAIQDIQILVNDLPLSMEDEELDKFRPKLKKELEDLGLDKYLSVEFMDLLDVDLELTVYRSRLEEEASNLMGDILEDEFDFYGSEVTEDYIRKKCRVLWGVLKFARRTFIVRSRSLQARMYEAEELTAVTKPDQKEPRVIDPNASDPEQMGEY